MKKIDGYTIYNAVDGEYCIADQAGWLPGVYDSELTALFAAKKMTSAQIKRWLEPLNSYFRESRSITREDVEAALEEERSSRTPEFTPNGLSMEEKLAKIEEMMHPGYWGTFDYKRKAILNVLGSQRQVWDATENPFKEHLESGEVPF